MAQDEDDEWIQVRRKGGRRKTPKKGKVGELPGMEPNANPEFSIDEIRKYHETVVRDWHTSGSWQALLQILQTATSTPNRPPITTAICLGPGPFDPANGSGNSRRTAHMQTAAFGSIVANLETQGHQKIRCVIQEPGFTQIDKQFCNQLGLEVVDTPDAFAMVDENTLVFGIHLELHIYERVLTTLPGVFIGAGLDEWEQLIDFNPELQGLGPIREMDSTFDKYPFPDVNYTFHRTTIYWRKSSEPAPDETVG